MRVDLDIKELAVTALVAHGLSNKIIARQMNTTEQVVKNHLTLIYDKTGMGTRLELALWYIANKENL